MRDSPYVWVVEHEKNYELVPLSMSQAEEEWWGRNLQV